MRAIPTGLVEVSVARYRRVSGCGPWDGVSNSGFPAGPGLVGMRCVIRGVGGIPGTARNLRDQHETNENAGNTGARITCMLVCECWAVPDGWELVGARYDRKRLRGNDLRRSPGVRTPLRTYCLHWACSLVELNRRVAVPTACAPERTQSTSAELRGDSVNGIVRVVLAGAILRGAAALRARGRSVRLMWWARSALMSQ